MLQMHELDGFWYGEQKIWTKPGEEAKKSPILALINEKKNHPAFTMSYQWRMYQELVKGSMVIEPKTQNNYTCLWEDSWHNKNTSMLLEGELLGTKMFSFLGSYGTKDNALWGWKIKITYPYTGIMTIFMYNITPKGEEALAVDIFLHKVKQPSYEQKLNKLKLNVKTKPS